MSDRPLDLDAVQAFVRIADYGSFTRAAEAGRTTQSAISLKLKRLEERLGCRLVERTPRHVELSARGLVFLEQARALLAAHDRACAAVTPQRRRLTIGISDHVAGPELPLLIARMNAEDPQLSIGIRIGSSGELLRAFDRREIDTVIVRFQDGRDDGEIIARERFGWFAAGRWQHRPGEPLPIATMPEPCGVRVLAGALLDQAGIAWTEVFTGGGVTAVAAAVTAGLGIAALSPRMVPMGAVDVGKRLGLPRLPRLPVVLYSRQQEGQSGGSQSGRAVAALVAAYRSAIR